MQFYIYILIACKRTVFLIWILEVSIFAWGGKMQQVYNKIQNYHQVFQLSKWSNYVRKSAVVCKWSIAISPHTLMQSFNPKIDLSFQVTDQFLLKAQSARYWVGTMCLPDLSNHLSHLKLLANRKCTGCTSAYHFGDVRVLVFILFIYF